MSVSQKIRTVATENLASEYPAMQNGEVFIITDSRFETIAESYDDVLRVFENDPNVGFVTTDLEHNSNGMCYYKNLTMQDLSDVPFFVKKVEGLQINLDPNAMMATMARSYLTAGLKFEHVADPYFRYNA